MRCRHCDYLLFNLTQNVCPECGRPFDLSDYRFEPGEVSFNCPHCDQTYYGNDAQGLPWPRSFTCVHCQQAVTLNELRVVPQRPEAMGHPASWSPWDRRGEIGLIGAWWETLGLVLFKPGQFYRRHSGRSLYEGWLFATISLYVGLVPYVLLTALIMWVMTQVAAGAAGAGAPPFPPMALHLMLGVYGFVMIAAPPIGAFVGAVIWAALIHPVLWLAAPQRKPFDYTLRLAMYSFAASALTAIPFCGGYVSSIWQLVVLIVGVKEVHGASGWLAALAVLWLMVLLMGAYAVILVVAIGSALA